MPRRADLGARLLGLLLPVHLHVAAERQPGDLPDACRAGRSSSASARPKPIENASTCTPPPARREVMAELVDEHQHAEHEQERRPRSRGGRQSVEHVRSIIRAGRWQCSAPVRRRRQRRRGTVGATRAARRVQRPVDRLQRVGRRRAQPSSTAATMAAISRKPMRRVAGRRPRRSRWPRSGSSGAPPPACKAVARQAQGRKAHRVGRARTPAGRCAARSSRGAGGGDAAPARRAHARSACACPARPAAPARCRRGSRPGRGSPIADAPAPRSPRSAGRTAAPPRSAPGPCSSWWRCRCEILAPIDQTGWRSAASGRGARHLLAASRCGTGRRRR